MVVGKLKKENPCEIACFDSNIKILPFFQSEGYHCTGASVDFAATSYIGKSCNACLIYGIRTSIAIFLERKLKSVAKIWFKSYIFWTCRNINLSAMLKTLDHKFSVRKRPKYFGFGYAFKFTVEQIRFNKICKPSNSNSNFSNFVFQIKTTIYLFLATICLFSYFRSYLLSTWTNMCGTVGFEPIAKKNAHNMILYGCARPDVSYRIYNCGETTDNNYCITGQHSQILFSWAPEADGYMLPDGIGFKIGKGTKIEYVVLQVYYERQLASGDESGMRIHFTQQV